MAEIAERAGVAKVTVSLALRNSRKVATDTRKRIRALAKEMGYRKNPGHSVIANRRWRGNRRAESLLVAILFESREAEGYQCKIRAEEIRAIKARGTTFGYEFDIFYFSDYPSAKRLEEVMFHRGVCGIIVGLFKKDARIKEMTFQHFPGVSLSAGYFIPSIPVVRNHISQSVSISFEACLQKGYERPGFLIPHLSLSELHRASMGMALLSLRSEGLPSGLLYEKQLEPDMVRNWYQEWRPDVVIGLNSGLKDFLTSISLRIPHDLGYVTMKKHKNDTLFAGVKATIEEVGEATLNQLDLLIRQNHFGLMANPPQLLVTPTWSDGESLPEKHSERNDVS
ncbi:MAG: LacI family DNA-binding transcriptional regulator [Opitutales bacterium]|nr:LacI family DNA-binding transcriptional regulator [Opitutales bacterium]NRA26588.1 LacI family DNA-binding transcriptional regulator [Opitutales bacterium]